MLRADINFELILIDDGSTDDTPQHLRYFSSTSQVSKLKVNEVNSGMGHCILEGVKIAK